MVLYGLVVRISDSHSGGRGSIPRGGSVIAVVGVYRDRVVLSSSFGVVVVVELCRRRRLSLQSARSRNFGLVRIGFCLVQIGFCYVRIGHLWRADRLLSRTHRPPSRADRVLSRTDRLTTKDFFLFSPNSPSSLPSLLIHYTSHSVVSPTSPPPRYYTSAIALGINTSLTHHHSISQKVLARRGVFNACSIFAAVIATPTRYMYIADGSFPTKIFLLVYSERDFRYLVFRNCCNPLDNCCRK